MTPPLWATVVVSVVGIGVGISVWLGSLRPRPEVARREIERRHLSRLDVALVSGGPARGLDSDIVDLVERGITPGTSWATRPTASGTPSPGASANGAPARATPAAPDRPRPGRNRYANAARAAS